MSDDVRAAAERVRRWRAGEWLAGIYPEAQDRSQEAALLECDWRDVALAYLAEHPADDGDALTPDRLRALGFSGPSDDWLSRGGPNDSLLVYCAGRSTGYPAVWLYEDGSDEGDAMTVPDPKTVGGLRRLCAALGVPLTEGA